MVHTQEPTEQVIGYDSVMYCRCQACLPDLCHGGNLPEDSKIELEQYAHGRMLSGASDIV